MAENAKFRAWSNEHNRYCDFVTLDENGRWIGWIKSSGVYLTTIDIILEQYTGLKDKNGKEIYEGNIIQETIIADDTTDGTFQYEVYWDDDMLCWSIKGISDADYHLHTDLWETNASREVIGNIHEGVKNG